MAGSAETIPLQDVASSINRTSYKGSIRHGFWNDQNSVQISRSGSIEENTEGAPVSQSAIASSPLSAEQLLLQLHRENHRRQFLIRPIAGLGGFFKIASHAATASPNPSQGHKSIPSLIFSIS